MNMSRFIRRPSLWLPGVTIAFSVYASLDAYLTNALPSSVGAFILSGMVFVISGLCVCRLPGMRHVYTASLRTWVGDVICFGYSLGF